MKRTRQLAYLVWVAILIALLVLGAFHWRSQFRAPGDTPAGSGQPTAP